MDHLTQRWASLRAQAITEDGRLSLEDVISVAEQVMERAGLAGRTIEVPDGRVDDPAYQAAIAPLNEYVRQVTGKPYVRIYYSAYSLAASGNPIALTDGMNYIVVRKTTNDMTILHECAHIIRDTSEFGGHDRAFAETARDLYRRYISPAAADKFWTILTTGGYL